MRVNHEFDELKIVHQNLVGNIRESKPKFFPLLLVWFHLNVVADLRIPLYKVFLQTVFHQWIHDRFCTLN